MAIVTKPMALDESMNTTESTSRNIADVLAQELSGIASAITGGDDKANKTDIATVEPTNTASRAYSVGELVYVNGNLYKVITAIASGATFTVGTNIQSTNVSGTVKDALDNMSAENVSYGSGTVKDALDATDFLSDITTSSGVTLRQDQGYAKIINGVKYIYLRFEISSGFTGRMKIGKLPTQGSPSTVIRMTSPCASTYEYPLTMVTTSFITSDGEIYAGDYISPSNTAIKELNIMAAYI